MRVCAWRVCHQVWLLTKKMARESERHTLAFTIPIFEPLPPQVVGRVVGWLGGWLAVFRGGIGVVEWGG
jgi:hypothetical protein